MEMKHGKYVVNFESSENQPPITCSEDQEAHSSACWHPPSNDITRDVSSNLIGGCVSPGAFAHSGYPHSELSQTQVKGSCCSTWSLWKSFLACLLACVITTAIGVLIICLVNNRGNDNSPIVIKLPTHNREPVVKVYGRTPTTSQPTVTTTSTKPTTVAPLMESTTIAAPAEPPATTFTTITSTASTTSVPSTELKTTAATTSTSHKTRAAPTSTEPTTSTRKEVNTTLL